MFYTNPIAAFGNMGCALCKSVAAIEGTTGHLKTTLDATQATLGEAELRIRTLETSVTSITQQVTDVRADLAKVMSLLETVPQAASMEILRVQSGGSFVPPVPSMSGALGNIGGLFSWSTPELPSPPAVKGPSFTVEVPSVTIEVPPPPPGPGPDAGPEGSNPAASGPEGAPPPRGEEEGAAATAPKKKVIIKKIVKKQSTESASPESS